MTSVEIRHKSKIDYWVALGLFALAIPVRFKDIASPSQVVFDEVHFGKYAAYYIQQSYFFDVHPPLAKLMIAWISWIFGFDGGFEFTTIGMEIPDNVPYIQMRAFCALFGTLVVPLAYLTIRDGGHSCLAALVAALSICFENGLITNNRLILLDSILLFFTAFTIFAYNRFYNSRPFTAYWWSWLILTGLGIGCNFSSKWVGLFTMATIGLSTIKQLWSLLGNLQITNPGTGDSFMTIEMQNELQGIKSADVPVPIVYGSYITLRHLESVNGYLHSHKAFYPEGSQQQQVTIYPFRDNNNWWKILKANETEQENFEDLIAADKKGSLQYIRNGDLVRLEHVETAPRRLHSHEITAPITETTYHKEVSGYGFPDYEGDSNDFWRVEIEEGDQLEARKSKFRLYHPNQNCRLYSNLRRLPDWGFRQQEVSCIVDGKKPRTMWMVDEHSNDMLPHHVSVAKEHQPGFLEKFIYLQGKMWNINQGLTETHPYESRPSSWPVLLTGISFWTVDKEQIFLLGHPLVYWASTLAMFNFLILAGFFALRDKRGCHDRFGGLRRFYETSAGFFAAAWAMHYIPFYFMERQLFLHHYMPALYFAVLTMAVGVDMITRRIARARFLVFVVIATAIVYVYWVYSPLTYGNSWDLESCEKAKVLDTWNWDCQRHIAVETHSSDQDETLSFDQDEDWDSVLETASVEDFDELEDSNQDYNLDKEDDEEVIPTEIPVYEEPESNIVDGTELVAGADDDDEDEWPSTVYGMDPEADDNDTTAELKNIPVTKHVEL